MPWPVITCAMALDSDLPRPLSAASHNLWPRPRWWRSMGSQKQGVRQWVHSLVRVMGSIKWLGLPDFRFEIVARKNYTKLHETNANLVAWAMDSDMRTQRNNVLANSCGAAGIHLKKKILEIDSWTRFSILPTGTVVCRGTSQTLVN